MTRRERARSIRARLGRQTGSRFAVLAAAIALAAMTIPSQWQSGAVAAETGKAEATPQLDALSAYPTSLAPIGTTGLATATARTLDSGPAGKRVFAAGTALDKVRAQQCLTMAIYYEAARESEDGQRAVAQVVLNRVAHPSYPNTVCGVVFQGSERNTGCQFTFTCDGSLARKPAKAWWDRASRVSREALAGAVYAPVGLATHYHTTEVDPYWAGSLQPVGRIGAHLFYRWKGAAGTKAAFTMVYGGGEPGARPYPKSSVPDVDENPVQLALAYESERVALSSPASHTPPPTTTDAIPAYADALESRGGDSLFKASNLPGGGEVSPQYRRSGEWIAKP